LPVTLQPPGVRLEPMALDWTLVGVLAIFFQAVAGRPLLAL
jgi:hypothetical protein